MAVTALDTGIHRGEIAAENGRDRLLVVEFTIRVGVRVCVCVGVRVRVCIGVCVRVCIGFFGGRVAARGIYVLRGGIGILPKIDDCYYPTRFAISVSKGLHLLFRNVQ